MKRFILHVALAIAYFGCSGTDGSRQATGTSGGKGSWESGTAEPNVDTSRHADLSGNLDVRRPGALDIQVAEDSGSTPEPAGGCGAASADAVLTTQPVDIIVFVDNSGSMSDEIVAVEKNINKNFAQILESSGVDFRVILVGRHGDATKNQSICIEAPLSGLASCVGQTDGSDPVFGERFFQHNSKLDSHDSLSLGIAFFNSPAKRDEQAPRGWSAWLRPGSKKVFLELTDDESTEMTWQAFDKALLAAAPQHFGTADARNYVFHSIIGLPEKPVVTDAWSPDEPIQKGTCTGNGGDVVNEGLQYQELSRLTGGLRFPICQFDAYDIVFQTIADDVSKRVEIACDFAIPPPPQGKELDLTRVAVSYVPGDGSRAKTFLQAPAEADCQSDAFYLRGERINLCPEACSLVKKDSKAKVDVLFTCEPTFIPLR